MRQADAGRTSTQTQDLTVRLINKKNLRYTKQYTLETQTGTFFHSQRAYTKTNTNENHQKISIPTLENKGYQIH